VRDTPLPGAGSLFIKTHPNSQWSGVDMPLNPDPVLARPSCVIAKSNPAEVYKCWEAASYGRAVHFEYNPQGTEVWVSIWGDAAKPGERGEIFIYTMPRWRKLPASRTWSPPPASSKDNTVHDIY